jgi:hypothetical protein
MCNPRRIQVSVTRRLNEAWQREVSRNVSLAENVVGEARVRQSLDATLGTPAIMALEMALDADNSGWTSVENGYRFDVEGGYVIYLMEERALEIVASLSDVVEACGEATEVLEGTLEDDVCVEGEGKYYDDGWGGQTKDKAEKAAQKDAEKKLKQAAQDKIKEAQTHAESQAEQDVQNQARIAAEKNLQEKVLTRREQLAQRAQEHLETVGVRCRQAFHEVLAQGYKNAILAYARRNGAVDLHTQDEGGIVDISFSLTT